MVVVLRPVSMLLFLFSVDTNCHRSGPCLDVGAVVVLLVVYESRNGFRALSVIVPNMVPGIVEELQWRKLGISGLSGNIRGIYIGLLKLDSQAKHSGYFIIPLLVERHCSLHI